MNKPYSVHEIARQAEERKYASIREQARHIPLTNASAKASLESQIRSKTYWIAQNSEGRNKRPEREIENRMVELAVLLRVNSKLFETEGAPDATD